MHDLLFVYGTLMQGIPSRVNGHFHAGATFLGEAQAAGFLYDLGHYPGFVHDEAADQLITGHLFRLSNPTHMLRFLDEYEGVGERFGVTDEYHRTLIEVHQSDTKLSAWCYLYHKNPANALKIAELNYFDFWSKTPKHRDFTSSV